MILIPTQAQDYSIDGLEELMDTFEIIKETENYEPPAPKICSK
jgi:chromosome partitioning protein